MVKGIRLWWLLGLVFWASSGFVVIEEAVTPLKLADRKIDKVLYGDLPVLTHAMEWFVQEHGRPPDEREGLAALVCSHPEEMHCIQYLSKDPWLHPYVYRRINRTPGYMIYSVGADGIDERGGGDDIVTWPKEYSCAEYGVGCLHLADKVESVAFLLVGASGLFLLVHGAATLIRGARS